VTTAVLSRRELSRHRATRHGGRIAIAIVIVGLVGFFAYFNELLRTAEAALSSFVLSSVFSYDLYPWRDQIIFRLGDNHYKAMVVTVECTSLVVLGPLLLFAAAVLVFTRVSFGRWLLSVVVATSIVFVANIIRIATIGFGYRAFGTAGYDWTHTVIGTAMIAIAIVVAVILMLRIQSHKMSPQRP
jgi:exosortase/archaeosortase family protein